MALKIILVGQSSAKSGPLDGASGRRLAALAGLDLEAFIDRFEIAALEPDGRSAAAAMLERADALRSKWSGRKVVLLGETVAAAFRLRKDDYEWFKPLEVPPGFEAAVMPQPSGVSTWWNDATNVEAARKFMLRLNVGYLAIERAGIKSTKAGRPESFSPEQVAAALVAADGLLLQAAQVLSEETGVSTSRVVLANYCERYPQLGELRERCRQALGDVAEMNVLGAVRDGDVETSRWLLRSKAFMGRGYEAQISGRFEVAGQVDHRHAHLHAKLSDVGLDPTRYSDEQLSAIEDFVGVASAPAGGVQPARPVGRDPARVEPPRKG